MRKTRPVKILFAASFMIALCCFLAACQAQAPQRTSLISGPRFAIDVKPGPEYDLVINILSIQTKRPPVMACWLETVDGKYFDTIFVSRNVAKHTWYSAPAEGRPEALPIWTHAAAQRNVDAVSGATPMAGSEIAGKAGTGIPAGTYTVKFEVNKSSDFNKSFPDKLPPGDSRFSGPNGQPSLLYTGTIRVGGGPASTMLEAKGTGSLRGTDGDVHSLDGMTTALGIVDSVMVSYRE